MGLFFKNINIGPKIFLGYGLTLALMTIVSIVVYFSISSIIDTSRMVDHTHRVISNAKLAGQAMVDMETGQRGFLITGEDQYLEPFNNGKDAFASLIENGKRLTSDNPAQVNRWDAVNELESKWVKEVAEPEIEARRNVTKGADANAYFKEVSSRLVGKGIFDSIRGMLAALNAKFESENNIEGVQLITLLTLDLVNMETGQRGYLLSGKDESLEPFIQGQANFKIHVEQLSENLSGSSVDKADLNALQSRVGDWINQAAQPEIDARKAMNLFPMTIEDLSEMMIKGKGKFYMDQMRVVIKDILDEEKSLIAVRSSEQDTASQTAKIVIIIGSLIAIVCGIIIATVITRGIVNPLRQTNNILRDIANGEGDLTKRLEVKSDDEIGQLSLHFNAFIAKLQGIISEVVNSSNQLASTAEEMTQVSRESSRGISQQNSEIIQIATSVNEMAATVEEVARNTENATGAAQNADNEAKSGNALVKETLESIKMLVSDVSKSAETLDKLKQKSENIGTVLDVIKGIAEQTNLLALNAAIEAARAGEQGRGFAVVADEVRTLAGRTQNSTSEIEVIITELQTGAAQAFDVMETCRVRSNTTFEQGQQTGQFLGSVTKAINTILEMNTQIAVAAQEQSMVTQEVNRNITNIQDLTEETSAGAEQATVSSQEVAKLSSKLQSLVAQFKV
tara:strand:- start:178 stop:2217 length:2040 start_codon:yes stop_codon:yes gene_type:complete